MNRQIALLLGLGSWAAACGSADDHPAPAPSVGGGASRGGTHSLPATSGQGGQGADSTAESGGSPDAVSSGGETSLAGASGAGDSAGGAGGAGTEPGPAPQFPCPSEAALEPPQVDSLCDPLGELGAGSRVPVDAGNRARFIAITPDALSIAWSAFGSSAIEYFVADRPSTDEDFGSPIKLADPDNAVGLSPDGLRLITLSLASGTYQERTRAGRGLEFESPTDGSFTLLNAAAAEDSLSYADCVISADDLTLYYTARSSADTGYPVKVSRRQAGEPWPVGTALEGCELEQHGQLVRHPTGISADGLTLFFWDPDRASARAAWRSSTDSAFSYFVDLPTVGPAAVNASCSQLYYSGAGDDTPLLLSVRP